MLSIAPEIFVLAPLALAAGVDLYLTLLVIGAATTTGLWATPLPGALGDLDSPGVLIMVGTFYLLEFAAERHPPASLAWNAFHSIIRPVSGALLALLVLDGQPLSLVIPGALLGGVLASAAHGMRSGAAVLRWLRAEPTPSLLLVSLAEDVVVLGLVTLTLDAPVWASAVSAAALVAMVRVGPSFLRAFSYAVRLSLARIFRTFHQRRWRGPDELPDVVREAFAHDDDLAPGGALRGSPVGAWRLPGTPRFSVGWVVVRGGDPVFVYRRRRGVARVDLGGMATVRIDDHDLYRRVDLGRDDGSKSAVAALLFASSGPSMESLAAEFGGGGGPEKNL